MPVYAMKVAYDGTGFAGSQRQVARRTVQGALEEALGRLTGETPQSLKLIFAGRTDAGVHAKGQVAAFKTKREWSANKWLKALNAVLPKEVAVVAVREAPADFHPRYQAVERTYRYAVLLSRSPDPLRHYTHHRISELSQETEMIEAWYSLIGTHDFINFRSAGSYERSTIVTIKSTNYQHETSDEIFFTVSAVSFLYRMVRRLVGTVLSIGRGILSVADFERYLSGQVAGLGPTLTAPAKGLCLLEVAYPAPWAWE
ncbi:MAG: tRNA pseudouridine(38-40) synthase TruA [Cyanobacteria bacterium NC_groundwater_1444_Ag_S-0.65um_54_12]|nr:tRNA pseudouridine(38-40) synthase TruA [Cyanobacteria bacterium NC_groundwater_1444_Ag_S-0.65um_54_12]